MTKKILDPHTAPIPGLDRRTAVTGAVAHSMAAGVPDVEAQASARN